MTKKWFCLAALSCVTLVAHGAGRVVSSSASGKMVIDTRAGKGAIPSDGTEALRYSNLWHGDSSATVTLAQDGVSLAEGLAGEGAYTWNVGRNGTYTLTHTTYTNGVAGVVETATFTVTGRNAPFADSDVTVTGWTGKYDGAAHGVSVVLADGIADVTVQYARVSDGGATEGSASADGGSGSGASLPPAGLAWAVTPPVFTDAGAYTVWCAIAAPGYLPVTNSATISISKRSVTLTSASASKVYDGTPLVKREVSVAGDGFASGEGATYTVTGSQTVVGESTNTFAYALNENTKAANYTITTSYGTLAVTPATLDADAVFGGGETDAAGRIVCARVYNGAPQPFEVVPNFGEPYRILYALAEGDESAYSETAPTRTHVAEGDLVVRFRLVSHNYAPHDGTGVLRIVPKTLAEAMVVADEDAAWFFDGTEKKPSVTVVDGNPNIASTNDWTVAYSDRTGAGLFPVTVTGTNDYCGTVTKAFAILKRPVAPPVIPSKAYSGRLQKPSVPSDARWTLVANPGGTDAGDYTNVVLRLTAPEDYRWKGQGEDETDWTGVFTIRKGANGWRVYPGISSWTNGVDAASEPQGQPRLGTLSVAYRRRGAPVSEETPVRPFTPGRYTARFWAEETANYAGVALTTPYEIDFEIFPGPGDPPADAATATTPVPVPHAWLDAYVARFGAGDYEAAGNAQGANGVALWASYVAGLDPTDAASRFTAVISVGADGVAHVTWTPDLSAAEPPRRYTVLGKARLDDAVWTPVTDANRAQMRFFKVRVEME